MITSMIEAPRKTPTQMGRARCAWVGHPRNSGGKHPGTRTGASETRDGLNTLS